MRSDYEIRSLAGLSFDDLFACHIEAFKDYPFQWSREGLQKTIHRRGFDPSLSFGAFYHGSLVAFTWNGIGFYKGAPTAYDTGTGTVEAHRGKGLASTIFEYSIPFLKRAGVQQYLLEVLQENEKAISVYAKQGFAVTRTFDCFRSPINDWQLPFRPVKEPVAFRQIDFSYQPEMLDMCDFTLSWQNDFQALNKNPDDFIAIGAFSNERFIGYGVVEPGTGDIAQLAVAKTERRKGIGSAILRELQKLVKADIVKVVNIESTQTATLNFVLGSGIPKIVSQFEMIKTL